jgi:hypothetical protein
MEQMLPGRRKVIVDSSKGRRQLLFLEDGVELSSAGPALVTRPTPNSNDER